MTAYSRAKVLGLKKYIDETPFFVASAKQLAEKFDVPLGDAMTVLWTPKVPGQRKDALGGGFWLVVNHGWTSEVSVVE